jgi:hypothetical protein
METESWVATNNLVFCSGSTFFQNLRERSLLHAGSIVIYTDVALYAPRSDLHIIYAIRHPWDVLSSSVGLSLGSAIPGCAEQLCGFESWEPSPPWMCWAALWVWVLGTFTTLDVLSSSVGLSPGNLHQYPVNYLMYIRISVIGFPIFLLDIFTHKHHLSEYIYLSANWTFSLWCVPLIKSGSLNWPWSTKILGHFITRIRKVIGHSNVKTHYEVTKKPITSVLKASTDLITNITDRSIRLTEILVIMSVSTFEIAVILYILYQFLWK